VLYEMLSGRRAFQGDTTIDAMTAIIKEDPPDFPTERHVPPGLERVIDRCLEKSPGSRFKSADDLAFALEALSGQSSGIAGEAVPPARERQPFAWTMAGALLVVSAVSVPFAVIHFREGTKETRPIQFDVRLPDKLNVLGVPAISPDGSRLAFSANLEGKTQLWVRPLDSTTSQPLPGTEGADYPFWSPDGRALGFFARGKLWKIDLSGGSPQMLCDALAGRGATWNRDGVIVFAPSQVGGLYRVASTGGASTPATTLDTSAGEVYHRSPIFLPDGQHFLFMCHRAPRRYRVYTSGLSIARRTDCC
jgi:eukaryotic-like serine/threonine-protein kinase